MNKEPETYEELIRYKNCVELSSCYELTKTELNKIHNHLATHKDALIEGNKNGLVLKINSNEEFVPEIINASCKSTVDGVIVTNKSITIIPHYNQSSSGSRYSSSGRSSNNNNNR